MNAKEISDSYPWQEAMKEAVAMFIDQATVGESSVHTGQTPNRVVAAFAEYVEGYKYAPEAVFEDRVFFEDSSAQDEMVHEYDIPVMSMCAHHLAPIIGSAHFAYIPKDKVIGLSKIPRFIDILARRLQIQERLCRQIVDCFPVHDCAVEIIAYHCCMLTRGVRVHPVKTVTSALRGAFKSHSTTRAEFFARPQELKLL